MKSRSEETILRGLFVNVERLEMRVVALSVALISSAVSMRIGGLMWPVVSLKVAKMIWNLAWQVSDTKMARGW